MDSSFSPTSSGALGATAVIDGVSAALPGAFPRALAWDSNEGLGGAWASNFALASCTALALADSGPPLEISTPPLAPFDKPLPVSPLLATPEPAWFPNPLPAALPRMLAFSASSPVDPGPVAPRFGGGNTGGSSTGGGRTGGGSTGAAETCGAGSTPGGGCSAGVFSMDAWMGGPFGRKDSPFNCSKAIAAQTTSANTTRSRRSLSPRTSSKCRTPRHSCNLPATKFLSASSNRPIITCRFFRGRPAARAISRALAVSSCRVLRSKTFCSIICSTTPNTQTIKSAIFSFFATIMVSILIDAAVRVESGRSISASARRMLESRRSAPRTDWTRSLGATTPMIASILAMLSSSRATMAQASGHAAPGPDFLFHAAWVTRALARRPVSQSNTSARCCLRAPSPKDRPSGSSPVAFELAVRLVHSFKVVNEPATASRFSPSTNNRKRFAARSKSSWSGAGIASISAATAIKIPDETPSRRTPTGGSHAASTTRFTSSCRPSSSIHDVMLDTPESDSRRLFWPTTSDNGTPGCL
mmetsp:Transcript_52006/g.114087  ORF Transcript_52006/g.114087 Transcript_52006/m.114087 type:complete len:529 (+) Transcript_52006:574-2160(+)